MTVSLNRGSMHALALVASAMMCTSCGAASGTASTSSRGITLVAPGVSIGPDMTPSFAVHIGPATSDPSLSASSQARPSRLPTLARIGLEAASIRGTIRADLDSGQRILVQDLTQSLSRGDTLVSGVTAPYVASGTVELVCIVNLRDGVEVLSRAGVAYESTLSGVFNRETASRECSSNL